MRNIRLRVRDGRARAARWARTQAARRSANLTAAQNAGGGSGANS